MDVSKDLPFRQSVCQTFALPVRLSIHPPTPSAASSGDVSVAGSASLFASLGERGCPVTGQGSSATRQPCSLGTCSRGNTRK